MPVTLPLDDPFSGRFFKPAPFSLVGHTLASLPLFVLGEPVTEGSYKFHENQKV